MDSVKTSFIPALLDEVKKVTWPTRQQTIYLTLVVFIICLIVGAYLGIIDVLLAQILQLLTKSK